MDLASIILLLIVLIIIVTAIRASIKVVPQYERLVVFRLGKVIGIKGPGLVFLIPFIDRAERIDLRERYIEVERQTCITQDNAPVDIDLLIYFKVVDPEKSVVEVQNFEGAATGIATTTLRAVVGDITLDHVLARREYINEVLRSKLDEVTSRWGVKVTAVEIREILPPREVQEAMIRQMSAERTRRAMITEADGKKEATIRVAEGEKMAAILKAEGERQALLLKAEGYASALRKISEAAADIDKNTMILQYLEAFKEIASAPSSKILIPIEITEIVKPIKRLLESTS